MDLHNPFDSYRMHLDARRARAATQGDLLRRLAAHIARAWGSPRPAARRRGRRSAVIVRA